MKVFLISCSLFAACLPGVMAADKYKAPNFKFKRQPHVEPVVRDVAELEKENYRIQERPESQRSLASESKAPKRDPSSAIKPDDFVGPRYWKYDPKSED